MAALVDLTFSQLKAAMVDSGIAAEAISIFNNRLVLNVGLVINKQVNDLNQSGCIAAFTKILNAGLKAQTTANIGKQTGERLAAFSAQTVLLGEFAVATYILATRYELNSAKNVIGGIELLTQPSLSAQPSLPEIEKRVLATNFSTMKGLVIGII